MSHTRERSRSVRATGTPGRTHLAALLACAAAAPLAAQSTAQPSILLRSDGPDVDSLLGRSVAALGDLNGDGIPELLAGAPEASPNAIPRAGQAFVVSGADGSILQTFTGPRADEQLGHSVANAGDLDGDGLDDLAIGSLTGLVNGQPNGVVEIYSGVDGSLLRRLEGTVPGGEFGQSIASAGDIDGNGIPDLVIGASRDDTSAPLAGAVFLIPDDPQAPWVTVRGSAGDNLGYAVAKVGDLNDDGLDDVIVGAPRVDSPNAGIGYVLVLSGADGSELRRVQGRQRSLFGFSVSGDGDFDRDGVPDIAVGAPLFDSRQQDVGVARVYSGATGSLLANVFGQRARDGMGERVSLRADANGDGFADFAVTGLGFDLQSPSITDAGILQVLAGGSQVELFRVSGEARSDSFGCSLAVADFDGDGFDDFVVGARTADFNGFSSGSAYLISPGFTGTPASTRRIGRPCVTFLGTRPFIEHTGELRNGPALEFRLRAGSPNAPSVLLVGSPSPMPFSLQTLGGFDCDLVIGSAPIVAPRTTDADGRATVSIPSVPVASASFGTSLAIQWAQTVAGTLPLPVVLSDGLEMTFGF